ncbi:hypothetical protein Sphch_1040 [Sphingobium chlorophenolicum L-1]|uniref:Uncharacterized protein n=1 Tax=Sphingobium chlorophenolicum L-1 TaxID=690566 RepID=F6EUL3_SPHCR|nr:hypothetical protein [Sphingobium chlorophenolicum]AEG48731.1 hypothetical protein Sphch_1040 [Sphingobium chlorophenolicum L-1]
MLFMTFRARAFDRLASMPSQGQFARPLAIASMLRPDHEAPDPHGGY